MKDKHALTLHYVMANDGAGGAIISFYESEKLAKFIELCEDEPFGEETYDSITMLSDSPIAHNVRNVRTIEDCIEEFEDNMEYSLGCMKPDYEREYAILLNMKRDRDHV
jgi:hypothetical protein